MPALTAIGASGLKDPLAGVAIAMGATLVLSLYGPTWLWVLRVLGAVIAMPVALALSPWSIDRYMHWNSPSVLGVLPRVVMMRTIYVALLRQERSAKQEALPARAFALLLTGLGSAEDGREQAQLLSRRLTAPVRLSAVTVTPGASIGVAMAAPGIAATELTRQADMAMYAAKTGGKNRIETFRPTHGRLVA